jgi:quercetin dioxygenase-like cupin family protein
MTPMQGLILAPDEGLAVENPVGGLMTFKLTSDQSGGALTALETVAAPGEGPPLHVHDEDELIYTLDGTFRIKVGDDTRAVPPRTFVFIPRGTPHTWQNIGPDPGRFFATVMPAAVAFEEFFRRYAELSVEDRGPEAFTRLAADTGAFRVVGPPLSESDRRS